MSDGSGRQGDEYVLHPHQIEQFKRNGYITLEAVLTDQEIASLEVDFDCFIGGEVPGMGRDFCDMSGPADRRFEDFSLVNAMLPRRYLPSLQGNLYERLSQSIARQLYGEDMGYDYDQFLSKKPGKARAAFAMHQDMGYWPVNTPDTRTATCSLAISDSLRSNGCIAFVPGSHKSAKLVPHRPKGSADRSDSHTLEIDLPANTPVEHVEVPRGSITVHDEWVVHGSGGNTSDQWRKTYVIAYRSLATIKYERSIGFTHSHNDKVNWQTALDLYQPG